MLLVDRIGDGRLHNLTGSVSGLFFILLPDFLVGFRRSQTGQDDEDERNADTVDEHLTVEAGTHGSFAHPAAFIIGRRLKSEKDFVMQ